jgi:hypothetical protein
VHADRFGLPEQRRQDRCQWHHHQRRGGNVNMTQVKCSSDSNTIDLFMS